MFFKGVELSLAYRIMKELVIIGILYMSILFVNGTQMEKSLLLVLIDSDQQEQQSIINAVTTSLEAYNNRTETFQVEYNLLETKVISILM